MRPVVSNPAEDLYTSLGPWAAADGEETGWALLHMCEAVTLYGLAPVYTYAFDSGDYPGWSILLDIDRVPDEALPYLAQFVGVTAPPGASGAENRDLIRNRPGWKRGTPDDLINAVKGTLIGSKRVTLLERDTSAYHATVRTFSVQTLDPAATQVMINTVKAAGLIVDLELIEGPTFTDVQATTAPNTFAARLAEFPTFGDVLDYVP